MTFHRLSRFLRPKMGLLRQNVDVSGQTKILWRGKTTRRNNLNKKQQKRAVDVVTNNNKRTESSLGKLLNVYI